jgi:ferric-dicitrate binding protein FerR (iron transport regulator)
MPSLVKDPEEIEILVARYLNGECSESELNELLIWAVQSKQHQKDLFDIKDIWDASLPVKQNTQNQLVYFYKSRYEKSKRAYLLLLRGAASIAALLLIGLLIRVTIYSNDPVYPANLQVFTVPLGSRSSLLLPDGTEVNLNSGSKLTYSDNFSKENRIVSLTGEAFFHVKSDSEHPFTVQTNDFDIRVNGTQFNLCSYQEDRFSTATLSEGKINLKLNNSDCTQDVKPGDKFVLDRKSNNFTLNAADVRQETAWKDGEFIFKNISFPDLIKRLERWYDVKLIVNDPRLIKYNYSGRFKNQETIWQVLDALKLTSPIDYQKTTFREFQLRYKARLIN